MALNLLIVDDSPAIRKILQRVLQQADVPIGGIFEAGDGVQALKVLEMQHISLILTDVNMPNMDGLQLLGRVKADARWKDIPVVLITTEGGQTKVMEALHLGAAGYVRKPFSADQIRDKLRGLY
ncbi:MAG: response regulator [Bryobacteraceae bacterium]|nr:response regulator [Bryobacteraceae bacterium]